jgi:hypothetical protein
MDSMLAFFQVGRLALRAVPLIGCGIVAGVVLHQLRCIEIDARSGRQDIGRKRNRLWLPSLN